MAAAMAAAPAGDTQLATAGEPDQPQDDKKFSMLPVDLDALIDNVKCPICMGILRNTHAVSVCMHRFCKGCIEKWLRSQRINNCPQCRVEFASRRDLRQDPQFDTLLSILFCDLDAFEQAIAPSTNTIERAKAIGQQLLKAQEERRQQQRALTSLPRAKQLQQQEEPAKAVAGAVVHVTVAGGSKQQPKQQQQQNSRSASPSIPGGLKRSNSQGAVQDSKRQRGDAVPELISPNGSKYRGVRAANGRYQARFKVGGKEVSVGHYDTAQEAAQAYDLEQIRRLGSKAQLNLPHLRPQYKEQLAREGSRPQSAGGAASAAAQPAASRQQSLSTMAAAGVLSGVRRPRSAGTEEAAAALEEMDATEEEEVVDPVEAGRQRASQLAQQFPMRNAFSCVTPIAHIQLEAVGQLDWEVRHLSCPAATSVGQLKQAMVFGLSQQFGTAAFARPLVLAVQNDLDSSVNFDALFVASSEGSLLLREHVTVRELLGLLEDCTEDLVLEYSC